MGLKEIQGCSQRVAEFFCRTLREISSYAPEEVTVCLISRDEAHDVGGVPPVTVSQQERLAATRTDPEQ